MALLAGTTQGIQVTVRGVVAFKVGGDDASIANTARRFLDNQETKIVNVFEGHPRSSWRSSPEPEPDDRAPF